MRNIGGWLKDPHDPRDEMHSWANRPLSAVPIKKEVNLWLPDMQIKSQNYNDCTGFSGSYAFRMALTHSSGVDPGDLSALWLYWIGRAVWGATDRDNGSYIRTQFQAVEVQGVCPNELFPENLGPFKVPSWAATKAAFKRRGVKRYRALASPDEAREALSEGFPVLGGWLIGHDFMGWTGGKAFDTEVNPTGGHAMCISGYDKNGDFLIPNSWGNEYGEAGWWRVTENFLTKTDSLWACDTRGDV